MNTEERIILKKLITLSKGEQLLKFLLEEEKQQIDKLQPPFFDENLNLLSQKSFLDFVHYSWFVPLLQQYNETEKHCFLTLFTAKQQNKLKQMLKVNPSLTIDLPPLAKKFFLNKLIYLLLNPEKTLLPINFLPTSPLNFLLFKTKDEILEIIDFLSLYDLSNSFAHIIDKTTIDKITSLLTIKQKKFLNRNLKEPFYFPPIDFKTWDGNVFSLQNILHKRGLWRFKLALTSQNKSFIWYIAHILDNGRGTILLNQEAKQDLALCQYIIKDIETVDNYLNERRKT